MLTNNTLLIAAITIVGFSGWLYKDSEAIEKLTDWGKSQSQSIKLDKSILPNVGKASTQQLSAQAKQDTKSGLKKCLEGTKILYTNGECPAGSRIQAVSGSVTVIAGDKSIKARAATNTKSIPNVRDLLAPPDEEINMREKMMDQAIGN